MLRIHALAYILRMEHQENLNINLLEWPMLGLAFDEFSMPVPVQSACSNFTR